MKENFENFKNFFEAKIISAYRRTIIEEIQKIDFWPKVNSPNILEFL
jgi:hypothetical protein